jgi:hypothetical protein
MRRMRMMLAVVALAGAAALVSGGTGARAASDQPVSGTIRSQLVMGPTCTSPIGLCTAGEFRGGIRGTFIFTATSLVPTADTPTTEVSLYTGDLVIQTKDGDLLIKDAGAFNTGSSGDVASVSTIVGGTAGLLGAAGAIRISGIFRSGCVDCEYRGRLRLP